MSDLLDRAVARVRSLPADAQDEAARLLLDWAQDVTGADRATAEDLAPEPVDPRHEAALAEGLRDAREGRIASSDDVEAAYASFRPDR